MQIKVAKFGGSSLSSAGQFKKVSDIVKSDKNRRYVVPSAPGKRSGNDDKVTDMLYACYDAVAIGKDFEEFFAPIRKRYTDIIEGLKLDLSLEDEFATIEKAFSENCGRDYAASRGEYLSGIILAAYLDFPFIDAAKVIFFDVNGKLDAPHSYQALTEMSHENEYAVIPGFYGSMPDGTIKTFSRGGSDITGSVVARGVDAEIYENWTDVSGFLVTDPRIVEEPQVIETITFKELRELSYMGATVLHEDAIFPVRTAGIPINIRNTNRPSDPGTMIVPPRVGEIRHGSITGIAGKKGFSVFHIEKDMMNQEVGFTRKVLSVFEKHGISFEHLPSGIDTMCIVVNSSVLSGRADMLAKEIKSAASADSVEVITGLSLIAVVGRGMVRSKGMAARLFTAIAKANINIRMIDQGSSELNIIIGVDDYDFKDTVNAIYNEFFG
ncbi:MAG: aspartate kinase [Clostridiales bacterium]|nr:aspartate kinase [Clostridiales bacterium]